MSKKHMNKTETTQIIISIVVLLGGAALTATSFCVYYLVKPQNMVALVVICVVDLLYNFFTTCMLFKFILDTNKWLLKGFVLSVGYTVAFIVVAVLFTALCGATDGALEFLQNNILGIVFYAFFTGPSIFIVLALFLLCLSYA